MNKYKATLGLLLAGLLTICGAVSLAQTGDGENIILGRPSNDSIVVHVLADDGIGVFAEFGETAGHYTDRTGVVESTLNGTAEILIDGL